MWTVLLDVGYAAVALVGMLGAAILGLSVSRRVQKSKGARAGAMMALAFLGMFNFVPPETTTISEPSDEMKVKRGTKPGDPPEPKCRDTV